MEIRKRGQSENTEITALRSDIMALLVLIQISLCTLILKSVLQIDDPLQTTIELAKFFHSADPKG